MTISLTPQLGLRVSSGLTSDARFNLFRIDELASRFAVLDDSSTIVRSQTAITLEPNSAAIGGTGIGGVLQIGTPSHVLDSIDIYGPASFSAPTGHLDQGTGGTAYLKLKYDSTLLGTQPVDGVSRTLMVYMAGADRVLSLGGNLSLTTNLTVTGSPLSLSVPTPTNWTLPPDTGSAGDVLTTDGAGVLTWEAPTALGVTSVGLAAPVSVFTVSGSPVTSAGTLTLGFATQSPNLVFAGPPTGGAATPTFRALVAADIPSGIAPTVADTNSIDLTISGGNVLTADLRTADATIDVVAGGARVAPLSLTDAQVSASAAILLTKTNLTGLVAKAIPAANDEILIYDVVGGSNKKATISSLVGSTSYAQTWTSGTSLVVTHNLNTTDVEVSVYDVVTGASIGLGTIARNSVNQVTLTSSEAAPGTGWRVVVLSAGSTSLPGVGVMSVGLALPSSVFSVSGSPVTTTGTLTGTLLTQVAATVWAGPATGPDATPTFRALAATDIPALAYQAPGAYVTALTGDVVAAGPGAAAATIQSNVVTNAKLAQMAATTIKGNSTGGTANAADLTGTQVTALLDSFTSSLKGLAPASGGGTTNFLRADGTWAVPPNSGGTVTSVSVTTANGVSGSVINPTTTPAITLTLGAITPTSVAASGAVTGSNLSGTNTGDQTITLTGDVTGSGTGSFAATVASVGGSTAAAVGTATVLANAATSANTPSTIVRRDGSGNFSATTITANLTGNASGTAANVTGVVAIANGGTGQTTAPAAFGALSPLTTKGDLLTYTTLNARLGVGTNGQVLTADSGQTTGLIWATPTTGTVTSVALAAPASILTVSGSPVTTTGTLTLTLATQTANTVWAGPAAAGPAAPTFRTLVAADIPLISLTTGVSGVLPVANGGTGASSLTTNGVVLGAGTSPVTVTAAGVADQVFRVPGAGGTPAFGAVDLSKAAAVTGTLAVANGGTGTTTSTGTGSNVLSNSPTLVTPALGTPSALVLTNATGLPLTTGVTGTLPIANGGTGQTTANAAFNALAPSTTKGDLIVFTTVNARVGVGNNGEILTADSTQASGVKWAPSPSAWMYGNGADGNVTISVNTTLTRDMYYNNLTVNGGVTLSSAGFRIFVAGTLSNAGTIAHNGTVGGNAVTTTAGAGGAGAAAGTVGGGATGATSANTAAAAGQTATTLAFSQNNSAGGSGGGGAGGAAGAAGGGAGATTYTPFFNVDPNVLYGANLIGGGGGGGSGSNGATNAGVRGDGGGGGGGAGLLFLWAFTLTNTGSIQANGGNGGNGAASTGTGGNGGGGGGGGGGCVFLVYNTITLGTVTASGGTGGAAGANGVGTAAVAGSAGQAGTILKYNATTSVWS